MGVGSSTWGQHCASTFNTIAQVGSEAPRVDAKSFAMEHVTWSSGIMTHSGTLSPPGQKVHMSADMPRLMLIEDRDEAIVVGGVDNSSPVARCRCRFDVRRFTSVR